MKSFDLSEAMEESGVGIDASGRFFVETDDNKLLSFPKEYLMAYLAVIIRMILEKK